MGYWRGHHWSGAGGNIAGIDVLLGILLYCHGLVGDSSRLFSACRVGPPVVDFGLQSGANSSLFRPAEWGQWYLILACWVGPAQVDFSLQRKGASKIISACRGRGPVCWFWGPPVMGPTIVVFGLQRKGASVLILGTPVMGPTIVDFRPAEEGGQCVGFGPPVMGPTIVLSGLQRKGASGLVWASSAGAPLSCFLACRGRGPVHRYGATSAGAHHSWCEACRGRANV